MSGTTSAERLKITTAGDIQFLNGNSLTYNGNTIWHSANDGAGSGLDADLLDGLSSGSFIQTPGSSSQMISGNASGAVNPDNVTINGLQYVSPGSISLFGQTDGALYSQAYSSSWIGQIFQDYRTGQLALRGKNSGNWQPWRRVLDSTNYAASNAWTPNFINVSASITSPGTFTKTGGTNNSWDSHVYSTEGYTDNVFVSCSAGQTNAWIMWGLNSDPTTSASYETIDYAFYFIGDGSVIIYESGTGISTGLTYATTDVYTIVYDGKYVTYYKNNTIVRQIARTLSTTKLYFDSSFYSSNASLTQVTYGTIGNEPYATSSSRLYSTDSSYEYFANNPYYGYLTYIAANGRWRFQVSPATPAAVEVSYADTSGSVSATSDQAIVNQNNGNSGAWYGRILSKNSTSDKSAFLGTYGTGTAGVFAHNNALNAWAQLYVNTTNGFNDGADVTIAGSGKVGIGVLTPLQKLDVRGSFLLAADGTTATHITQKPYTINNGTLSWEGSAGQLFSITNNLTSGSIFSVNDVSGIPSIDVDANGTVELAPFGGNVGIGTTNPTTKLHVIGDILASGNVTAYSDSQLKDNVETIDKPLEKVLGLRGVTFTRVDIEDKDKKHIGVIAQEVEQVLPEVVLEHSDGIKSVAYGNMVGLLIEAIKEQQNQIESLKAEIESLKRG